MKKDTDTKKVKVLKKVRSNAQWIGLTSGQRRTLEGWLFDDLLGFAESIERARRELGFTGSLSSLKRFYARRAREREVEGFGVSRDEAEAVNGAPGDAGVFRAAAMKRLARLLFKRVQEAPDDLAEWGMLATLLLKSEENELRRELKGEENEIRRECLEFAKERFRFNVVEEAQKALPELQALAEARKDPQLAKYEEAKRVNGILRCLFGENLPEPLHPESPEEEAAVAKADAKAEAKAKAEAEEERIAAAMRHREQILRKQEARKAMEAEQWRARATAAATAKGPAQEPEARMEEQPEEEPERPGAGCLTDEEWARQHPGNGSDGGGDDGGLRMVDGGKAA
jgi:hypothetical protein